jgi:hypothetical protein
VGNSALADPAASDAALTRCRRTALGGPTAPEALAAQLPRLGLRRAL